MFKKYVVCEERIKDKSSYTVRINTDCNPLRFKILADFDTYTKANDYIDCLRHPEDYFNNDDN